MAAKPSTAAEEALQKIQEQVTCGICLDSYKQPKLLKCFHVFCEQCLQRLVRGGASLPCPQCRKVTPLPVGGVSNLQGAFHHNALLDIYNTLKNSGDRCPKHPEKEAEFFCEACDELLCSRCLLPNHRDHQYDLVAELFAKHEKVIRDSLKPVKEQIAMLEGAIKLVDTRCAVVIEQKVAVVAEIHAVMAHLRQVLEARETKLVGQAEQTAQQKLKSLAAQRDRFELRLGQLKSCHDFVEESRHTCSQGEILGMKSPLLKQINEVTGSFKPETLALAKQADIRFGHSLPELVKTYQQFGKVYCHPVCPEKCRASGKGIKAALRGQTVTMSVQALDRKGEAYLWPVESLRCELVASDGSSRVRGTVKRRNGNRYNISYQPQATGEYQLHILIEEQPILNSPFTVTVLPNLTSPASIIGDLRNPWGIAVREGGQMVVVEHGRHCVSVVSGNGEKKSFGSLGSAPGQFCYPRGVAIDAGENILVVDTGNYRIQQLSSTGKHLRTVGACGPLQFQCPGGIAVHPQTHKVYVADWGKNRIEVLNSDLIYSSSFGRLGSNNGEFNLPCDLSTDSDGNVYVADSDNHRIQVFTADGMYLRQFGKKGEGEGELKYPVSIAIDSHNVVYVGEEGNNRISKFSTDGEFIMSFGSEGEGPVQCEKPCGLAVDKKETLYVSDFVNHHIQIFT